MWKKMPRSLNNRKKNKSKRRIRKRKRRKSLKRKSIFLTILYFLMSLSSDQAGDLKRKRQKAVLLMGTIMRWRTRRETLIMKT